MLQVSLPLELGYDTFLSKTSIGSFVFCSFVWCKHNLQIMNELAEGSVNYNTCHAIA